MRPLFMSFLGRVILDHTKQCSLLTTESLLRKYPCNVWYTIRYTRTSPVMFKANLLFAVVLPWSQIFLLWDTYVGFVTPYRRLAWIKISVCYKCNTFSQFILLNNLWIRADIFVRKFEFVNILLLYKRQPFSFWKIQKSC